MDEAKLESAVDKEVSQEDSGMATGIVKPDEAADD
jgi:hypothetical protein